MQIHSLQNKYKKEKKRVGRGGKRGTTSGKGTKGQKSRSGHRIRPAIRDLISKFPKRRGIKHPRLSAEAIVINVGDLEKRISGNIIDKKILLNAGVIRSSRGRVKILGKGQTSRAWTLSGVEVSESAKKMIEKAGGSIRS